MQTGLVLDTIFKEHETAWDHPEAPERIDAIVEAFRAAGLFECCIRLEPRAASLNEIGRVHDANYVKEVLAVIAAGTPWLANGDVSVCRRSGEIALLAAGAGIVAVDAVMTDRLRNAFCAVRPPGHHATANTAMGFCVFNNIAVTARHAQMAHGAKRVAIVDWDVHHGNGTQDIFYEDSTVLFCSTHQSPWYPGTGGASETGRGAGEETTINRPFRAGAGSAEILGAFRDDFAPAILEFRPDLILISAGFDSRIGDPLGELRLADADFATLTALVMELAETCCGGRVVSLLEGGYSLSGLASAATSHFRTLMDAKQP